MTVLVAVEARTGVVLGWDSGCFDADDDDNAGDCSDLVSHKGFVRSGVGIAFAGSLRCVQAAEQDLGVPQYVHGEDPCMWVGRHLLPQIKALGRRHAELGEQGWCTAIVAVAGAAIAIYPDWSVHRSPYGYVVQGSGSAYAHGAVAALDWIPPKGRVKRAIGAAARHCASVSEPVHTVWVPA